MLIFGSKIISGKRGNRKVKRYTMAYWPPIARLPTWCVRGRKLSENRLENGPYLAVALHLLPLRRNALYSIAPETDNNGSLPRSQTEKKHHRLHFSWFDYEIHVFPFWYLQHKKKEKKKINSSPANHGLWALFSDTFKFCTCQKIFQFPCQFCLESISEHFSL